MGQILDNLLSRKYFNAQFLTVQIVTEMILHASATAKVSRKCIKSEKLTSNMPVIAAK